MSAALSVLRRAARVALFRLGFCLFAGLLPIGLTQASNELPPPQAAAIEAARAALSAAELSPAQRQSAEAQLDLAASLDKEATPLAEQLSSLREKLQTPAPAPTPLTPAERQNQLTQWASRLPTHAGLDTLEHLLAEEHKATAALKARIDSLAAELTELISRPGQPLDQLSALRQQVEDTAGELQADTDEPAELLNARRLRRSAEHRHALLALALHEAGQASSETRQRQLESQIQSLRREQALRAPRIEWLNQHIAAESLRQLQAQAKTQAELAAGSERNDSALASLLQSNAGLAQQLLDGTRALAGERRALAAGERQREQISAALRETQARLRLGGNNSAAFGHWLWQQRLAMPSLLALHAQRKQVQQRLANLRLNLYNQAEARYALTRDADGDANGELAGLEAPDPLGQPNAATAKNAALNEAEALRLESAQATQMSLLDQLEQLLRRRISVLEQHDAALHTLLTRGGELLQLMDRQLLWTPSHAPVNQQWLGEWRERLADVATLGTMLLASLRHLLLDLGNDPLRYLILSAVLLALLALRLRAPGQLRSISQHIRNPDKDRFTLTLQALLWTLLIALPGAVAAWGIGLALQDVGARHGSDVEAVGHSLTEIAQLLLLTGLWGAMSQPAGLAQAHFGWPQNQVRALRRAKPLAVALIVPIAFVATLALHHGSGVAISTWGRLALLTLSLSLSVLFWLLLRRLRPGKNRDKTRFMPLRLLGWLLPFAFFAVALLALSGYIHTGSEVFDALFTSLTVLLGVLLIDGLLRRWLLLSERRLARKRLQKLRAAASNHVVDVESGEAPPESEPELTLVNISAQSHRLLRLLRITLMLLGLLWAWSDVLPALLRFDSVVLWNSTGTGADGNPAALPVTLMDLLFGLVALLLTFSMARNLPGLLELALSSSRLISNATRYTLTTLLRYAITIAGVLLAFGLFGLRWSQLQWMAAALTVGLGFGLQEIFANFVSGLILLVERPFRVGDTITIGNDLTGTVTRIRTRATTILDYDNKEIVIPNKTFITDQVTNWTLSDSVTRLTLNVGAAYGSNPEQVRQLLLRAAHEHPTVLDDPAPNAWFMALGDSTLDFELRVYVAALGDRLRVRSDLNRRITELLEEAGIEIAFPQMDLHLRDMPAPPAPPAAAPGAPG